MENLGSQSQSSLSGCAVASASLWDDLSGIVVPGTACTVADSDRSDETRPLQYELSNCGLSLSSLMLGQE